ncbi:hypothetical protein JOF53_000205 [Crossiella equi]|uniref:Uncharacterized protein n=1 Tax=Crossiella equi TaxID=130796 RepID=A0ABS5A431_9PSEU|nr:hypothetical protein [Crossiella equi]MBP2471333.1 hypothetical protein [Crossiella equi]
MINNSGTQWQLREAGGQRPAFVDLWTASVRKVVNLMEVEDHAGFRDLR